MKNVVITGLAALMFFVNPVICMGEDTVFSSDADEKEFALEITDLIEKSWRVWQDGLIINNVEVNGGRGILFPGGMSGEVLTTGKILRGIEKKDISAPQMKCYEAIAGAVAECMRVWQRGYRNENIPFPEGSFSSYSLTPCVNIPVTVSSGFSSGERRLTESNLYDYMVYRSPKADESVFEVFQAAAMAFCQGFKEWKENCVIEEIRAAGGVAPIPAPMGTGPGPVRGAKGSGGKLTGAYFSGKKMYEQMVSHLRHPEPSPSS